MTKPRWGWNSARPASAIVAKAGVVLSPGRAAFFVAPYFSAVRSGEVRSPLLFLQQFGELLGVEGEAEGVPLGIPDAEGDGPVEVVLEVDFLGDQGPAERFGQGEGAAHDGGCA